ncbi:MAG: diversity-generating retroelement protein Avd [Cyanobacteria bacterium J06629_9]
MQGELPIIQKTYDLVKWYVPILNRLPRDHRFMLGDRMIAGLYELLENLVTARYERDKLARLKRLNGRLDVLRYQTRLLLDLELMSARRYEYASQLINGVGVELGGWIRYQTGKAQASTAEAQGEHETAR